ncbi:MULTISPECIES: ATP-grasp fold amidoligase family protein [unclassified Enterococcus]|uniref:ATP-grasp fold amidoligase family protein n=1 Tax=unclassified Enterococcus TaxID=2608891 RepID=UPI001CE0F439|nr:MULTISPECIES: ATP-grasp fold amidoligase family protein [unclassified Enterococcus]MCA5014439.1 hypothetical protein [Enterococcus sp. S23]MCA5017447.1 hypothetical protein [Enterococcus sp. S22(2020)]
MKNPILFSEKLQWLKFYYTEEPLAWLAGDKFGLRQFLQQKNVSELAVPLIDVYRSADEIDWEKLPNQFVIKKSNASGMNLIVKDKAAADQTKCLSHIHNWMQKEFGEIGAELHYKKMLPQIIIEEYLENIEQDWKFFFLNGKPQLIQVNQWADEEAAEIVSEPESILVWCDMAGKIEQVYSKYDLPTDAYQIGKNIQLPTYFDQMIEYGKILSEDFPMVRVDFFYHAGKLYLSELTFTPGSGFRKFNDVIERKLGQALVLPEWP